MNATAEAESDQKGRGRKARKRKARGSRRNGPPKQPGGPMYGLGMIGALVYFAERAESGQDYAWALGKAMVWPALLVYQAFKKLGA